MYVWRLATFPRLDRAQREKLEGLISEDGVAKAAREERESQERDPQTKEDAERALKIEQAKMAKIKRLQLEGSLVEASVVEDSIAACCTVLREEVLRMLDVGPQRLGLDPAGEGVLRELVEETLTRIRDRGDLEMLKARDPAHGVVKRGPGRPKVKNG